MTGVAAAGVPQKRVVIYPTAPRRVFVAALGHPHGPNTERGIFRTLDNGSSWKRVLSAGEDAGGMDLTLVHARRAACTG